MHLRLIFLIVHFLFIISEIKTQNIDSLIKSKLKLTQIDSSHFSINIDQIEVGNVLFKKGDLNPKIHFEYKDIYFDDSMKTLKNSNEYLYDDLKDFVISNYFYSNGNLKMKEIKFLNIEDTIEYFSEDNLSRKLEENDTNYYRIGRSIRKFIKPISQQIFNRIDIETGFRDVVGIQSKGDYIKDVLTFFYNLNGKIDSIEYYFRNSNSIKFKKETDIIDLVKYIDFDKNPKLVLTRVNKRNNNSKLEIEKLDDKINAKVEELKRKIKITKKSK